MIEKNAFLDLTPWEYLAKYQQAENSNRQRY